ncbi:organic cation/carnitine transporter 7-like isoform X1 [Henckelia pumila]|uniref:organic cation/carnitine transporter 7-like isoform X1 n=1 Tax=Henckelia pumila TaxID=405737 RepID=UPI003C6E92A5
MENQNNVYTLDEALSEVGFGNFQSLALVFAGVGWFSEAMEMNLLSFIGPAVKSEWSLSPTEESLLSTAVFAGMLIGAYFWGFLSDSYGRRMGLRCIAAVTVGAGFLSSFSPNYGSLLVLRCLLGFAVAGGHVFGSWLLEFIPSSNRGAWMLSLLIFWILGEVFEASIAWIIMPRLGWRWLLALSALPSLIALVLSNFIPESPRYLHMKGKTNETLRILEKIALINHKKLPTGCLVSDQEMVIDEDDSTSQVTLLSSSIKKTTFLKSMFELLSSDLRGTTLLLWILHFTFTFAYYGVVLMTSALSSGSNECASKTNNLEVSKDATLYVSVFIACLAEFPGFLIATVLVDRIGRKLTMEILTIFGLILILPLASHQNQVVTTALLFGTRMFLFAAFSTLTIYAKEVYPTCVRASGSGLATSMGRIGGMICPLVAVGLVRGCHQTAAVVMFGIVIVISGICVLFFKFETKGRGLSDNIVSTAQ